MGIQNVGLQALSLATTAVLARILSPSEFGLVAIVMVLLGLFRLINQVGWGAALIVRKQLSTEIISTAFWVATVFGGLTATLLAVFAVPLGSLFGNAGAAPLIRGIAVVLVLGPPGAVARALLLRDLRYRATSLLKLTEQVVYTLFAIVLASVVGLGVWSIILGRVAASAVGLVLMLVVVRPPVKLVFRWTELAADLPFNAGFLANRSVSYVGKNVDYWAVGRFLGDGPLGAYYIAYVAPNIVRQRVSTALQATMFPLLARISGDRERLKRVWLESTQKALLLVAPAMVGLALVADAAIEVLFGSQWASAAAPMRILAIAAMLNVVTAASGSVFAATGKPHLSAVGGALLAVVVGSLAVPAARIAGTEGVAWAVLVGTASVTVLMLYLLNREIHIRLREIVSMAKPTVLPLATMIIAVLGVNAALSRTGAVLQLAALVPLGATAYWITGIGLHRTAFASLGRDLLALIAGPRRRKG